MKRLFDFVAAFLGLVVTAPVLMVFMVLVFLRDFGSPFYMAPRVGRGGRPFAMVKLRSMIVDADQSGVASTSQNDPRITRVGRLIRKYKLDELTQLWNVLTGTMSIVGPRPQVQRDVDLYTKIEKDLLSVKPGITDFSSIVFSDEGTILANAADPDLEYCRLIRPWKSRMGLLYIDNMSLWFGIKLNWLTAEAILSKQAAPRSIVTILERTGAPRDLIEVARR